MQMVATTLTIIESGITKVSAGRLSLRQRVKGYRVLEGKVCQQERLGGMLDHYYRDAG